MLQPTQEELKRLKVEMICCVAVVQAAVDLLDICEDGTMVPSRQENTGKAAEIIEKLAQAIHTLHTSREAIGRE